MGHYIERGIEPDKPEKKGLADCPYRKNSNAYKHWMEGMWAMYDCLIIDMQEYIEFGRDTHNKAVQDYVNNFYENTLELNEYDILKKQLRKEGRAI